MGINLDRRHVGHVNRFFLLADPPWRVLHNAGRCDCDLGGEEMVAARPAARAEYVACPERPALTVHGPREHPREYKEGDETIGNPYSRVLRVHSCSASLSILPHRRLLMARCKQ